jgi:hypothetical protein
LFCVGVNDKGMLALREFAGNGSVFASFFAVAEFASIQFPATFRNSGESSDTTFVGSDGRIGGRRRLRRRQCRPSDGSVLSAARRRNGALDLTDYHMTELASSGHMPGWISKHTARLEGNDTIVIAGGQAVLNRDAQEVYRPNIEEYALDLRSGSWQRLTHRNWRQFAVRMERPGMFDINHWPSPKKLLPEGIDHSVVACDSLLGLRIMVRGVAVAVSVGVSEIKILVEGELPRDLVGRIVESIRVNAEKAIEARCLLQEL